jgi:hypothetical protein
MTSRSSDPIARRIAALQTRRAALRLAYAKACRDHRGAAKARKALAEATRAQIECELRLARAAPLKRAEARRQAQAPDLFHMEAQP